MWRSCFPDVDVKAMIELECGVVWVYLMQTTIEHTNSGLGVFPTRAFLIVEAIRVYYGSLVYHDLFKELLWMKEYDEGTMAVLTSTFN